MVAVIFVVLHLIVCAGTGIGIWSGRIRTRYPIFPVVVFVPVWGILLLMLEENKAALRRRRAKEIGIESFKIQDVKYQRIEVDESKNQEITVPLEEAMLVNDASVRRRLMLDILRRNPEEYIELLQKASNAQDTELTHYATTTMMEIQGRYEAKIHALKEEVRQEPENTAVLRKYRRMLKKYIESGLITGNILDIYRRQLDEIEEQLVRQNPEKRKYVLERIENRIALGQCEGLEEELKQLAEDGGQEEEVYRVFVEYYWQTRQGDKMKELLEQMQEKNIYLTHEGKKWYEFWREREPDV